MKICTACNTTYSDDTLNFCLVDGTTLTPEKNITFDQVPFSYNPGSWSETETPTQVSGTPVSYPNTEPPTGASSFPSYVPQNFSSSPPPPSNPSRGLMFPAIVAGAVIFGIIAGVLMATSWNKPGTVYPVAIKNPAANTPSNSASVTNAPAYTNAAPANNSVLSNPNKAASSQKFDLTGTWRGKFNEASATLNITTQRGDSFSGTLSKNGYVVEFTGQINQTKRTVSIKETKVLKTPPNLIWNLGENSGTISEDGKTMSGTGKDKNVSYGWSFTRD